MAKGTGNCRPGKNECAGHRLVYTEHESWQANSSGGTTSHTSKYTSVCVCVYKRRCYIVDIKGIKKVGLSGELLRQKHRDLSGQLKDTETG